MHMTINIEGFCIVFSFPENEKARAERAAGRSRFSICFTWLQAAANHHDEFRA
jgi:hypothetical protein